jgi:FkbM family methyltransferase
MPGSMTPFRIVRPRDINIEIAISDREEMIEFHTFKEPLFNSANKELAESRRENFGEEKNSANTHLVQATTLKAILDEYLPESTEIDFLSIDIEGLDLNALKSNDWSKYRPKYILVEILGESIQSLSQTETFQFLSNIGYEAVSKLVHTVVFREKSMGRIAHF